MSDEFPGATSDSVRAFLSIVRQRWLVILACLIIVPVAAYAYASSQAKQYSATANLLAGSPAGEGLVGSRTASTPVTQTTDLNTLVNLASLSLVSDRTAKALGTPYANAGLPGKVLVNNDGSSNILTVTATERSGALAALVANTYANSVASFSTASNVARIKKEQADLRLQVRRLGRRGRNSAAASDLKQQIAQLGTLSALQNTSLQLVGPATTPTSASSPKTTQIVLAGVALGILLGILLAVLLAVLDRRLHDSRDIEAIHDGPILGAIPRSRALARAWGSDGDGPSGLDLESFSMVYANMSSYHHDKPLRSILITSATGGEGKSTVAWNLALTGARSGAKVLLIEADMRRPTIASRIGAEVDSGLIDVLGEGKLGLQDVIRSVPLSAYQELSKPAQADGPRIRQPGANGVHALSRGRATSGLGATPRRGRGRAVLRSWLLDGGAPAADPRADAAADNERGFELKVVFAGQYTRKGSIGSSRRSPQAMLGSKQMVNLIRAAESEYDLVVIDSPPTSAVSDAIPLIKEVSGVVVVSRVRKNTRESAQHLHDQLQNLQARTVGVVVNGVNASDSYYTSAAAYIDE